MTAVLDCEISSDPTMSPQQGLRHPAEGPHRLLADLFRRQIELTPIDYLRSHCDPASIHDKIRIFDWYAPHLPKSGAVLDWGCNQAADSCLVRACFGDRFEQHGCDFQPPGQYEVFHDFAQLNYTQLTDPLVLPYESEQFSAVIAAGTLEHTAMDYEALKELYRVMKPGGVLIIDRLPNWLSIDEWKRRHIWKSRFHRRLYGVRDTIALLKRTGFYPLDGGYHSTFWERRLKWFGSGPRVAAWCRGLTKLFPFRLRCPTLRFIAEKRTVM